MSDLPPPSGSDVEQLRAELAQSRAALVREREITARLREVIESQAGVHAADLAVRDRQIAELADRVSQLERQANRDSSTSGKPPSSDSPYSKERKKPTDRSLRARTGRRRGKQPGAPGSTLQRVADPDETIECPPACCRGCAGNLADAPVEAMNARQVFEPPPPAAAVCDRVSGTGPPLRSVRDVDRGGGAGVGGRAGPVRATDARARGEPGLW